MSDMAAAPQVSTEGTAPLTQWQRLACVFYAPSKTFADIRRSASWWLPFLLGVIVVGYIYNYAVERQVGWNQVAANLMAQPAQQHKLANVPAEKMPQVRHQYVVSTRYFSYGSPVLILLVTAIVSAVLLGTLNFGMGGHATFWQVFAVWTYASFPGIIKYLLAALTLFAGLDPAQFNIQNPVGTNLAYYLSPESPAWLMGVAANIDIFTVWRVALLIIGLAIVARVRKGQAAAAVIGWWVLTILFGIVSATVF